MKLKYTYFDNREQYEEAVASDVNVAWRICDVDSASVEDFAEYLENILIDDNAPECSEEIHILVIDRDGSASDDFREACEETGCHNFANKTEEILTYFAEKRENDMQELVSLAWENDKYLYAKLCELFHVYELYHIEVSKELNDDEAVEAALNSTDGVREVIHSKEPLDVTLRKDVWQGKTGTTTTVDYFLEV